MISSSASESDSVPSEGNPATYSKGSHQVSRLEKEVAFLKNQLKQLKTETSSVLAEERQRQLEIGALRAELDKERGSREEIVATQVNAKAVFMRQEISNDWAKSEAAWKERIRNERLLRLSYERVLIGLGFAPNRIASDLVRVSRPQPLHENPEDYRTINLLEIEAGMSSQPQTVRKGLLAYSVNEARMGLPTMTQQNLDKDVASEFYAVTSSLGRGRRDLLKSLSTM